MEPTANNEELIDAAPNIVESQTWEEAIVPNNNLSQIGAGLSVVGKPLQSTNFKEGQTGWRINSNGDAEFNSIDVRGASNSEVLSTYQPINGSVTPKPVLVFSDGRVLISDANDAELDAFSGFVTGNYSNTTPASFLNITTSTTDGFTASINAGVDRVLLLWVGISVTSGLVTSPTSVVWGSNSMTQVGVESTVGDNKITLWRYIAGSSTTDQSGTITLSGEAGTGLGYHLHAVAYQYVNQTTPLGTLTFGEAYPSNTSIAVSLVTTESYNNVSSMTICKEPVTLDGAFTSRGTTGTGFDSAVGDGFVTGISSTTFTSTFAASTDRVIGVVELFNSGADMDINVNTVGNIRGFTGLTPGAYYYLSNTAGEISTTPGATSVLVGKALTADKLLIINN